MTRQNKISTILFVQHAGSRQQQRAQTVLLTANNSKIWQFFFFKYWGWGEVVDVLFQALLLGLLSDSQTIFIFEKYLILIISWKLSNQWEYNIIFKLVRTPIKCIIKQNTRIIRIVVMMQPCFLRRDCYQLCVWYYSSKKRQNVQRRGGRE